MTARTCSVQSCTAAYRAKGLCNMHWQRLRRTGSLLPMDGRREGATKGLPPRPVTELFWSKVDKSGDCWVWTASRSPLGYGRFNLFVESEGRNRLRIASRVSYEMEHGPIPAGMFVRHKCDNPPCVNPAHLELGSHIENMRDMRERGRSATGENHSQARLTWADVELIRKRISEGTVSNAALAREYGVSGSTVDNIANGVTWKIAEEKYADERA